MKKDCSVYALTNLVNGKVYIGKVRKRTPELRWDAHIAAALRGKSTYPIHRAIRKYGVKNFSAEVIHRCTAKNLDAAERRFIKERNTLVPNGYNLMSGGQGGALEGVVLKRWLKVMASAEHRAVQSARARAAHEADPTLGFRKTKHQIGKQRPGHGARVSAKLKGRKISKAEADRLRALNRARVESGATSVFMTAYWARPGMREKNSEALLRFHASPEGALERARISARAKARWAAKKKAA